MSEPKTTDHPDDIRTEGAPILAKWLEDHGTESLQHLRH